MILRRLIGQRLKSYYEQPANKVVGSTTLVGESSINFASLWGEWHWKRVYGRMYRDQDGQWLTPVELFRPYYSNTVANFVIQALGPHDDIANDDRVEIVELGGGRGTNARLVLDHIKSHFPSLYEKLVYTIIDVSPSLQTIQRNEISSSAHADKVRFEQKDLLDVAEGRKPLFALDAPASKETPSVVIGLEALDNLAHDKVRLVRTKSGRNRLEQAELEDDTSNPPQLKEVFAILSDPLLSRILDLAPFYASSSAASWIPSVACGLMLQIAQERPNSSLLLADFDWLPPPDRFPSDSSTASEPAPCDGEPLITCMDGYDHQSYLTAPSLSDILFPTNFDKLALIAKAAFPKERSVRVEKQADFLRRYGSEQVGRTKSWLTG